jgi:hypothetical protein
MPVGTYPALPIQTVQSAAASAIEQQGANPNAASEISILQAMLNNAAAAASNLANYQTTAGASLTLSNLTGLWQTLTNAGAVTVTFDNAFNIVNNIPGPFAGMIWPFNITTTSTGTVATPTVTNTGVTLAGTTSVAANSTRFYQAKITQLFTTTGYLAVNPTWTSLAQIGSSNLYTVTLGANSGATPTVGTAIFLSGITGTLPAGWYPIYSAASATSFVIAAPPSAAAWTATAVTSIGTLSAAPNVYAPLLTVQGICTHSGAAA